MMIVKMKAILILTMSIMVPQDPILTQMLGIFQGSQGKVMIRSGENLQFCSGKSNVILKKD